MVQSVKFFHKLCSTVTTDRNMVLKGNFNLPGIDWFYYHAAYNAVSELFIHFVNSYGLTQFVNQPTHNNNILNLVLCSSSSLVSDINVLPPISTSDHDVILFISNVSTDMNMSHYEMHYDSYNYVRADYISLNNYLLTVDWNAQFQ